MDLSIIIVNWNTRTLLRDCLAAVQANLGALQAEVWVVDNGSTDGSVEMLIALFPRVRLIRNRENRGFAAANNQALRRARGRYVLLLNTDTLVHGPVLADALRWMEAHPRTAVMGPRIVNPDGSPQISATRFPSLPLLALQTLGLTRITGLGRYRPPPPDAPRQVEVISGCAMLLRHSAIRAVGFLDESFFFYGEETDWCRRFARAGWQIDYVPLGRITHFGGGSVHALNHRRDVMLTEGTVRLHRKHGGLSAGIACFALLATFNASRALLWSLLSLSGRPAARTRARHFRAVLACTAQTWPKDGRR